MNASHSWRNKSAVVGPQTRPVPPGRSRQTAAFTLIEIMIVIGIAALVLAWGVPSVVKGMRRDALRQAVSDVMEACSHARARAILQGMPMELTIRSQDGQLTVQPVRERGGESKPVFNMTTEFGGSTPQDPVAMKPFNAKLSDDVAVELLDVNFRDQMEMDEARVRFFPNGTCDEFTMVLRSLQGEIQKVSLDIVTSLPSAEVIK